MKFGASVNISSVFTTRVLPLVMLVNISSIDVSKLGDAN